jgi:putative ABC transport system substrate-binding protein
MRRREFITLVGGMTAIPLAAHAQTGERIRRIAVLMNPEPNEDSQVALAVFVRALRELGWTDGSNVRIETRWAGGSASAVRKYAAELVALAPDVIFATGTVDMAPLLEATRTVPIVFVQVADPVGAGFIRSLARPGGNVTGFVQFEYSLSAKWLELLKQIVPGMTQVAVLRDPAVTAGIGQFAVIESLAPSLGIDVTAINVHDAGEIKRDVASFASSGNGGLILTASALAVVHRELVIALTAQYKLPAIYYRRSFVTSGGLISYGYIVTDHFQRAAAYVDRILKGEKPADLPAQTPTKYELVINLKTAKALGLSIPQPLLASADEVIE